MTSGTNFSGTISKLNDRDSSCVLRVLRAFVIKALVPTHRKVARSNDEASRLLWRVGTAEWRSWQRPKSARHSHGSRRGLRAGRGAVPRSPPAPGAVRARAADGSQTGGWTAS